MADETLFPLGAAEKTKEVRVSDPAAVRFSRPVRNQVELSQCALDSLLDDDHQARTVWEYAEQADLAELYAAIKAVEGHAGRPAVDPRILLALWLYATLEGVGSARKLDELSREHVAYRWIRGGVSVNYHTLSDFRTDSEAVLNQLLTQSVARLRSQGLVTLNRVAHDGMRVRASAGSGSFRTKETLKQYLEEAESQVQALRKELKDNPAGSSARQKAARERAARERKERVAEALRQEVEIREHKMKDKDEARASVTDPDARKMRMADGGFRPAYNVQISTDTASQIIVDVKATQANSDGGQLAPAVERIAQRHQVVPEEMLCDAGFAKKEDVETLASEPGRCAVYMPVPAPKTRDGKPSMNPQLDSESVVEWKERMATEEAQKVYKERASTAECVNAQMRNRGCQQFVVRGINKVNAVLLLFALAHNLVRAAAITAGLT